MEDKIPLWLNLAVSFLGGGIVSAIISALFNIYQSNESKKSDFLEQQLQKLYGPLYWHVSQTEKLFDLNKRVINAHRNEYEYKKWSNEADTQRILKEESTTTLRVANEYISRVKENNQRMLAIIDENYSFIDKDDIEAFQLFFEHKIRNEIEYDQNGKLKIPLSIYKDIGNVSFLRPEVIDLIKTKFLEKKKKLKKE